MNASDVIRLARQYRDNERARRVTLSIVRLIDENKNGAAVRSIYALALLAFSRRKST